MTWKPTNQPIRYDQKRVAQLGPIRAEIDKLGLPLVRFRKLNAIRSALEMQIEDGGDNPEVNQRLLDALRAGILHQVGDREAQAALQAIDAFDQLEAQRWAQIKAGTLAPIQLDPDEKLDDLMQEGYTLIYEQRQMAAGCDRWLEAWELVKQLATADIRSADEFDRAYPLTQSVSNWISDMEMGLGNAGLGDARYHEHRIRFVHETLSQFPDMDGLTYLNMRRAEGEALWHLGRQAEAEAVFRALVEKLPDQAWAYIGWADNYYMQHDAIQDYPSAEAILRQALARPSLEDREDVLERLIDMYEEWGQPEKQSPLVAELAHLEARERIWSRSSVPNWSKPWPPGPKNPNAMIPVGVAAAKSTNTAT